MTAMSYQVTVPVDDLFLSAAATTGVPADWAEADAISSTYGVEVVADWAGRPSVSLADAYKVRDARANAQRELQDALVAEAAEVEQAGIRTGIAAVVNREQERHE